MNEDKPAVKTTIVGGRPPGSGTQIGDIPRGIEVLVKKAAVDPPFKARLIENRSAVADEIALVLTPAEKTMLNTIPTAQLESIIAKTKVNSKLVPVLLTGTAAVILAALAIYAGKDIVQCVIYEFRSMGHRLEGSVPNQEADRDYDRARRAIQGTRPD